MFVEDGNMSAGIDHIRRLDREFSRTGMDGSCGAYFGSLYLLETPPQWWFCFVFMCA